MLDPPYSCWLPAKVGFAPVRVFTWKGQKSESTARAERGTDVWFAEAVTASTIRALCTQHPRPPTKILKIFDVLVGG